MSHPVIEKDECIGCGICVEECPQDVLALSDEGVSVVANEQACIACGICQEACPVGAITEIVTE